MLKRVATIAKAAANLAHIRALFRDNPDALRREPMFCYETAVRLFYWARWAYQWGVEGTMQTQSYALGLFNLHSEECMHDEDLDTKMVMGWSDDCLVLAFRGTASKKNVITDLKLFSKLYPGQAWRHGLSVRVHSGFYHAWSGNGFNKAAGPGAGHYRRLQRRRRVSDLGDWTFFGWGARQPRSPGD